MVNLNSAIRKAPARLAGLALTVACWWWATTAARSGTWSLVQIWVGPLLAFPITWLGRNALASDPRPERAEGVNVVVHYAMMIVLGCSLFPAVRAILSMPTITLPVLRYFAWALVILTGVSTFLTVLNLAIRGLGAPFAVKLSTRLATEWMYSWTRNPMLLCALAWFLCLGVWHQSAWFILFLAVSVAPGWIHFVKVYEERELEIRFGAAYAEYRARTPFLWPRIARPAARAPAKRAEG
jgi:protein-S-isoprenylcysteine O-methyltransferase Ste14